MLERLAAYWGNTKEMPLLLRLLCQGGMVVAPFLLLFLALPLVDWEIDGRRMSYSQLWSTGYGLAFAVALALTGVGVWGLAARNQFSRWLLVLAPTAPYVVLTAYSVSGISANTPIGTTVLLQAVGTSAVVYVCLFHLRVVRAYLDGKGVVQ